MEVSVAGRLLLQQLHQRGLHTAALVRHLLHLLQQLVFFSAGERRGRGGEGRGGEERGGEGRGGEGRGGEGRGGEGMRRGGEWGEEGRGGEGRRRKGSGKRREEGLDSKCPRATSVTIYNT